MTDPDADSALTVPPPRRFPRVVVWLVSLMVVGGLTGLTTVWLTLSLLAPLGGSASQSMFKVQPGEGARAIAARLEQEGYIRSQPALLGYLRMSGSQFVEGIYYLNRAGSSLANIEPILTGRIAETQITIPEGLRLNEIAERLEAAAIVASQDFLAAVRYNPSLVALPANYNLKSDTFLEGFLFPDTYRLPAEGTAADIIRRFMETYLDRTAELDVNYETLILASIIEREARFPEDRALIAGVYANRLKVGMPLQADPTVQYGKANQLHSCPDDMNGGCATPKVEQGSGEEWWPTLTVADYQSVQSPYNTYRITGLPPRPIANPGLASIRAAAAPAKHDYMYFISDADGHAHFATTLEQHNANKVKYLQ